MPRGLNFLKERRYEKNEQEPRFRVVSSAIRVFALRTPPYTTRHHRRRPPLGTTPTANSIPTLIRVVSSAILASSPSAPTDNANGSSFALLPLLRYVALICPHRNPYGTFLCSREAVNRLKPGGGGRIILFSSSQVAALRPGFGAYTAAKAAVEAMTKILAKELKGTAITANCVAPGPIATELFFCGRTEEQVKKIIEESPRKRLGETKDVAPLVGFLASDAGEWVNGQIIRVNGGYV